MSLALDNSHVRGIRLGPGQTRVSWIPVSGSPLPVLEIRSDKGDFVGSGTPNARFVAARVPSLTYVRVGGR